MNDYGIKPQTAWFLIQKEGFNPLPTDTYKPTDLYGGNTNFKNNVLNEKGTLNWDLSTSDGVDVRLFYANEFD